jgi:hypothetical protein
MSSNNRDRRRAVGGAGMAVGAAFVAALAFSAATAHADPWVYVPDAHGPTPLGPSWGQTSSYVPYVLGQHQQYTDYSVLNDPSKTFVGLWTNDQGYFNGLDDTNIYVEQDISGNVPVGEQYNDFMIGDFWGVVYNDIGVTPEAFYITPFGDINVPTWFVEAVGPTFFEPSAPWLEGVSAATLPAAELPAELLGLAPAAEADTDIDPFQDLFGTAGINTWTTAADSSLASIDPTGNLAGNLDTSVESFLANEIPSLNFPQGDDQFTFLLWTFDPSAFTPGACGFGCLPPGLDPAVLPDSNIADFAVGLDYTLFASGIGGNDLGLYDLFVSPALTLANTFGELEFLLALITGGAL